MTGRGWRETRDLRRQNELRGSDWSASGGRAYLAEDFPIMAALLDGLDEITHRHGGRVYLAKDARYGPERLREGYPRFGAFEAVRAEAAGAPPRFTSELSRRLAL